jgi:hypothetical protein
VSVEGQNPMTHDEHVAFMRGYSFGSEAQIRAHDGLLSIVIELMWSAWIEDADEDEAEAALNDLDARVRAVMADVKHARYEAAAEALRAFGFERTAVGR